VRTFPARAHSIRRKVGQAFSCHLATLLFFVRSGFVPAMSLGGGAAGRCLTMMPAQRHASAAAGLGCYAGGVSRSLHLRLPSVGPLP
jgi:hypothetical protein